MGHIFHINLLQVFIIFSGFHLDFSSASDSITISQSIKDPETVSSKDSALKLGFFSPENSTNRYVGIWYLSESNIVWVANRNQPLRDNSGVVTISEDGNLVVLNGKHQVVWSSNVSVTSFNSTAQLLDSGNLVLVDDSTGKILWESFQHPSDTILPKMRISTNKITGKKVQLTSWKSTSDPSNGYFTWSLERLDAPEVFYWVNANGTPYWRSGPWNGRIFIGNPQMANAWVHWSVGYDEDGIVYFNYTFAVPSAFGWLSFNPEGKPKAVIYKNKVEVYRSVLEDTYCDIYGICGAFGSCNIQNTPICSCISGFKPRNVKEWNRQNWTSGCVRKVALKCERLQNGSQVREEADGFLKFPNMKVPDFVERSSDEKVDNCESECLKNCSCLAHAYDPGIGCMYWSRDLIDLQKFSTGGVDLYIRVAYSELEKPTDKRRDKKLIIAIPVTVGTITLVACACLACYTCHLRKRTAKHVVPEIQNPRMTEDLKQVKLDDLPLFDFETLATATNNFDLANKLGKGGFGPVYKGVLQDGQEIAVKRLSRASGQGLEEFMNEVVVISKLQHRNLVKLLGCCIEGEEKMLIYEFMPNKSLDAFLFDPSKQKSLEWKNRFNIIEGIARGLLYLHRDSRLKIIHKDLKASNILLDEKMNPKISDFGMARIFGGYEDVGNTNRVVGTYDYMSPEYTMEGLFSEKSDIFSFGILLLEIVSGRRNTSFYSDLDSRTLLGFAWKLWNDSSITSLIDSEISDPCNHMNIFRCIHIGLLCVQELARDRPTMAIVISMLNSEIVNLPSPRQPAFTIKQTTLSAAMSNQRRDDLHSINDVTMTCLQGR